MKKWFLIICLAISVISLIAELIAFYFDAGGKIIIGLFSSFIIFLIIFILAVPNEDERNNGYGDDGSGAYYF